MTLDRMRSLDRVIGSAVCLVLSMVHRLVSLVRPTRTPVSPRNILIIEISEMGCLVLAYPMLEALRRRYPEAILDRKSTRLNSSHLVISYAVFCLKKKNKKQHKYKIHSETQQPELRRHV